MIDGVVVKELVVHTLFYHTTERYDPADEERIPYDDARIGFDWRTQHR
jgi:dTDP-4-dehydrorhamnose 3,5-epimerase-like enzyme